MDFGELGRVCALVQNMEKASMMKLPVVILIAVFAVSGLAGNAGADNQGPGTGLPASTGLPPQLTSMPTVSTLPLSQAPSVYAPSPAAVQPLTPPFSDYAANMKSDVFGANLFTGSFVRAGATQFNQNYAVAVGDIVQVRFWGAFTYDALVTVDPKGNIFLPNVGPVQVLGVRNEDLQRVIESAVGKVFRSNVYSYASLASAQPVRVFVGGFVNRPGLYDGTSMTSILNYLDQAGGIDPERGSFLNVQVKRGETVRTTVNLYDFLLQGRMPLIQFADGDVIFVSPRQNVVRVSGLAENAKRFEFSDSARTVADIMKVAKPLANATNVRVVRNSGTVVNTEYYTLAEAPNVSLQNGDDLAFTADKKIGTITVRVDGEHLSPQEYTLPSGTTFGDLIKKIQLSDRSDSSNLQLFRLSVQERQKAMLNTALKSLEASVLTARSATSDEAVLRKTEADLILQWIARAQSIQPTGQVIIANSAGRDGLLLENGDEIRIPARESLVLISGEVLFPTTVIIDKKYSVTDYIQSAGGFTQNADTSRIVIAHLDGSFEEAKTGSIFGSTRVRPGDQILVLPRIDTKSLQITKDLTQILFQIAVTAKVALGL